ncbi:putative quinol monooxygenase [Pseudoxanthomonas sp. UTMC 1351]|uniref:putative quinol monooxygenase n=1 Tax=Pseudoxanthomonas sp. UTMC 1351 TaxID=2695853 RepID=UPI0034CD5DE1
MQITRRDFMATTAATAMVTAIPGWISERGKDMYGLIGKMKAAPGQRAALIAILLEDVGEMPGCHSYVVAEDPKDDDAIWITEVWDSQESHRASLSLPSVQQAISRAKPIIAGFEESFETRPVGGHGLLLGS